MTIDTDALVNRARTARERAHAPYSNYFVGAAILDEQGRIHAGCNVENAAYPLGSCAEVNAIGAMVSAGGERIVAIVILGGRQDLEACTPCGGCRQRILEFADENTEVLVQGDDGELQHLSIEELLPTPFKFPG